jgi:TPP-dependent pyruvate/acetoin dehydrogenase alpha subunit
VEDHLGSPNLPEWGKKEEVEEWKKRDPIGRFQEKLITLGILKEGIQKNVGCVVRTHRWAA